MMKRIWNKCGEAKGTLKEPSIVFILYVSKLEKQQELILCSGALKQE